MFKRNILAWLPWAVSVTLMAGMVFGIAQYLLRAGANDPQIQLAEDAALALAAGVEPSVALPSGTVEVSNSLSSFVNVYDRSGKLLAGNGVLDAERFTIPQGVFDYTGVYGQDRITWQPRGGVRQAIVVQRFQIVSATGEGETRFVVAGRSLREVEQRQEAVLWLVALAWIFSQVAMFLCLAVVQRFSKAQSA